MVARERKHTVSNQQIAQVLDEMARRLATMGENPFRVAAYRRAAQNVRDWPEPLEILFTREGRRALMRLPGIGSSLAKTIAQLLRDGHSRRLARLIHRQERLDPLTRLPQVGPTLAERIRQALASDALDEVFAAAYDGRLQRIAGLGRKRVQAIRDSLRVRLGRGAPRTITPIGPQPSVAELLAIDALYRRKAAADRLPRVAPKQFNPTGSAWLPVLNTNRGGRHYTAHYDNSATSHRLGRQRDWVVIDRRDKQQPGQWTVVTATHGPLAGKRVVRGRERESLEYFNSAKLTQLSLTDADTL